MLQYKNLLKKL